MKNVKVLPTIRISCKAIRVDFSHYLVYFYILSSRNLLVIEFKSWFFLHLKLCCFYFSKFFSYVNLECSSSITVPMFLLEIVNWSKFIDVLKRTELYLKPEQFFERTVLSNNLFRKNSQIQRFRLVASAPYIHDSTYICSPV